MTRDPFLLTKHFMRIVKCKQHLWPCLMRYSFHHYYYLSLHSSAFIVKENEKRKKPLIPFNITNKTSTPPIQFNIFHQKERSEPNPMAKKRIENILSWFSVVFSLFICCVILNQYLIFIRTKWITFCIKWSGFVSYCLLNKHYKMQPFQCFTWHSQRLK